MEAQVLTIKDVVDNGYCVGCGACAFVSKTKMQLNSFGEYQPDIDAINLVPSAEIESVHKSCPSLHPELNEDILGKELFSQEASYDPFLGFVQSSYAGYAIEGKYRDLGTSGGMGTWVASELLRKGLIDGVIHVKAVPRGDITDPFFKYGLSESLEQIQDGSKTRYHVVEMSELLETVSQSDKRYLFIGVPCMSKAIRRIQKLQPQLVDRIPFVISLVCGHLKSVNWSLSLAWGAGIHPSKASAMQYRTKGEGIPARAYVYRASGDHNNVVQKDSAAVVGGKFNVGAMMLPACDYCDDVVGETADLTIGDAWIPRFDVDDGGTNLLIVRNLVIGRLLTDALADGRIMLESISNAEAVESQSGGYRQRREGLSYRLGREIKKGRKVPIKRVQPNSISISNARKHIYDGRSSVTRESRDSFLRAMVQDDYSVYVTEMGKKLKRLRYLELRNSFFRLAYKKLKRIVLSRVKK